MMNLYEGGLAVVPKADHPNRTLVLTLTRTRWGDQRLDEGGGVHSLICTPGVSLGLIQMRTKRNKTEAIPCTTAPITPPPSRSRFSTLDISTAAGQVSVCQTDRRWENISPRAFRRRIIVHYWHPPGLFEQWSLENRPGGVVCEVHRRMPHVNPTNARVHKVVDYAKYTVMDYTNVPGITAVGKKKSQQQQ